MRERLFKYGSPTWARTRDTRINSPMLYQLSYWGMVLLKLSAQDGAYYSRILLAVNALFDNFMKFYATFQKFR